MTTRSLGNRTEYETRLIRKKHIVGFALGWEAGAITRALARVPEAAALVEVLDEDGIITLAFVEEREESPDGK